MTTTRADFSGVLQAGIMAVAIGLLAQPALGQSTSQQAGRPQPPPAPKTAPAQADAPKTAAPATPAPPAATTAKAPDAQASKPKTAGPQTTSGKKPPAKTPVSKKPAPPRTSKVWKGRGFAVVSGGAQVAAPGYTSTAVFKLHAEDATLSADSSIDVGPVFGARGGVRVWKNMALGGGLAVASTTQTLDVTGNLPHPFLFDREREVSGTTSGLGRLETMVAFEASWLVALSRRIDMFVFGGPAYINVRQDMATRILFTESYPYDTASFTDVETASVSGGGFGFTVGADVAYLMTRTVGVGGEIRYSYATATLTPAGEASKVGLGGLQVGVCARILF